MEILASTVREKNVATGGPTDSFSVEKQTRELNKLIASYEKDNYDALLTSSSSAGLTPEQIRTRANQLAYEVVMEDYISEPLRYAAEKRETQEYARRYSEFYNGARNEEEAELVVEPAWAFWYAVAELCEFPDTGHEYIAEKLGLDYKVMEKMWDNVMVVASMRLYPTW